MHLSDIDVNNRFSATRYDDCFFFFNLTTAGSAIASDERYILFDNCTVFDRGSTERRYIGQHQGDLPTARGALSSHHGPPISLQVRPSPTSVVFCCRHVMCLSSVVLFFFPVLCCFVEPVCLCCLVSNHLITKLICRRVLQDHDTR